MVEKYKEKVEYMIKRRKMSSKECYCEVNKGVPMIRFRCLDGYDFVSLAFSTRLGGVTDKDYLSSLNFGWDRGDKEENVRENYRRMCKALGTDYKKLILSDQVHGDKIEYVDSELISSDGNNKYLYGKISIKNIDLDIYISNYHLLYSISELISRYKYIGHNEEKVLEIFDKLENRKKIQEKEKQIPPATSIQYRAV